MSRGQAKAVAFVAGFVLFIFSFGVTVDAAARSDGPPFFWGLSLLLLGVAFAAGGLYGPMGRKRGRRQKRRDSPP